MFHKNINHIPNLLLIVSSILLTLFSDGDSNAESHSFKRIVKEKIIASLDSSTFMPDSFAVSPDGRRMAYVEKIGNKQVVVVDGVRQKVYDEIQFGDYFPLEFSPDSSKIGFFAREDKRWFFVIDGKEQKEHQPVTTLNPSSNLRFNYSKEAAHYCYVAKTADKQYLVVDGKVGSNEYEEIFPCIFSCDGKRIACTVREGKKLFEVIDGVKQKEYSVIGSLTFSPNGKRFAYMAYPDKAWAQRSQRWLMVIDGREEKDYWRVWPGYDFFSPDSRRTAYMADTGTDDMPKPVIVLDGREISDESAGLSSPVFSPDSKRIAYMAKVYKKGFMMPSPPPTYDFNVVDGKPGKTYDRASIPVFSPDSHRLAYYGVIQGKYMMVIDNEEGKHYDDIGHPVFSRDSKRVGYYARQGADCFIVVDGKEFNAYASFSKPIFSPDSKRICYFAKKSGKRTVVIDDIVGQFYDEIYPRNWRKRVADNGIGFSLDDSFYYFAKKGNEIIFVQETIDTAD